MTAFGVFSFDLAGPLIDQVAEYLSTLNWAPLTPEEVDRHLARPDRSALGVYLLGMRTDRQPDLEGVQPIYVGQSQKAIYARLAKHARFVQDRCGLADGNVLFKAAKILTFDSVAVESRLIERFGTKRVKGDADSGWNLSGVGNNDKGGGRDAQDAADFDLRWPINIFVEKTPIFQGARSGRQAPVKTISQAIRSLSRAVPYTVRVNRTDKHSDDLDREVPLDETVTTTYSAAKEILSHLPVDWTACVYPGHIVFSKANFNGVPDVSPAQWPPQFDRHSFLVIRS